MFIVTANKNNPLEQSWTLDTSVEVDALTKTLASQGVVKVTISEPSTVAGDTAVIKGLRAAFEDLEQIACDNSVDEQVSGLLTALHDHFDYWFREDNAHEELATVLDQWLTIAEQHSGIALDQGREVQ
jgi:hypothetical protein